MTFKEHILNMIMAPSTSQELCQKMAKLHYKHVYIITVFTVTQPPATVPLELTGHLWQFLHKFGKLIFDVLWVLLMILVGFLMFPSIQFMLMVMSLMFLMTFLFVSDFILYNLFWILEYPGGVFDVLVCVLGVPEYVLGVLDHLMVYLLFLFVSLIH